MGGQAGTQNRGHIVDRPVKHFYEWFPEHLVGQLRTDDIGASDDEGIKPFILDIIK